MMGRILPALAMAAFLASPLSTVPTVAQGGPPPLAAPAAQEQVGASWFAAIDGEPRGPFTEETLRERGLSADTLVWRDGMPDWTPIAQVPELNRPRGTVGVRPPPLPPPPADTTEYFVAENGAPSSPLTRDEIARRIAAGSIDGTTLIWHEGMAEWGTLAGSRLASLLDASSGADRVVRDTTVATDPRDVVVGRWQGRVSQPVEGLPVPVDIAMTAAFARDGTFSYTGSGLMDLSSQGVQQPVRLEVTIEGTWQGVTLAPDRLRASLSGTIRLAAPELDMVESEPLNEVITLDIVDPDTIRDDEGNVFARVRG